MPEETHPSRLLRMLLLLSGNRFYSRDELAEKYGASERTIYRDLQVIENAGFVLDRRTCGYRLTTDSPSTRDIQQILHFTEEEAAVLFDMLSSIEGSSPVKERLLRKMNTFYDLRILKRLRDKDDLAKVHTLSESMRKKKQVCLIQYRSSNSSSIENRTVEVFEFLPDYAAVWCFDVDSRSCKQFKIARMESTKLLSSNWRFSDRHQPPFVDAFRISSDDEPIDIRLKLTLKAYNLLIEEFPTSVNFVQKKGSHYIFQTKIADFTGVGRFIMGLPADVEIEAPELLRVYVRKKIRLFKIRETTS